MRVFSDRIKTTECLLADLLIKRVFGFKKRLVERAAVNARKSELIYALRRDNVGAQVVEMLRTNKCKLHFIIYSTLACKVAPVAFINNWCNRGKVNAYVALEMHIQSWEEICFCVSGSDFHMDGLTRPESFIHIKTRG